MKRAFYLFIIVMGFIFISNYLYSNENVKDNPKVVKEENFDDEFSDEIEILEIDESEKEGNKLSNKDLSKKNNSVVNNNSDCEELIEIIYIEKYVEGLEEEKPKISFPNDYKPEINDFSSYYKNYFSYIYPSGKIRRLIELARKNLGKKGEFKTNEYTFKADCSGFVTYIFESLGVNLLENIDNGSKFCSKTEAIHYVCESKKYIHYKKYPNIGDIVFFNNTYDRNRDGKLNDLYTHIGIVESIEKDGTINFIHFVNKALGVVRDKMNLLEPSNKEKNTTLRVISANDPKDTKYLSGELFNSFASIKDLY